MFSRGDMGAPMGGGGGMGGGGQMGGMRGGMGMGGGMGGGMYVHKWLKFLFYSSNIFWFYWSIAL